MRTVVFGVRVAGLSLGALCAMGSAGSSATGLIMSDCPAALSSCAGSSQKYGEPDGDEPPGGGEPKGGEHWPGKPGGNSATSNSNSNANSNSYSGSKSSATTGASTSSSGGNTLGGAEVETGPISTGASKSTVGNTSTGASNSTVGNTSTGPSTSTVGNLSNASKSTVGNTTTGPSTATVGNTSTGNNTNTTGASNSSTSIDASDRSSYSTRLIYIPAIVPPTPPTSLGVGNIVKDTGSCGPLQRVVREPVEGTFYGFFNKTRVPQGFYERLVPFVDEHGAQQDYRQVPIAGGGYRLFGHQVTQYTTVVGVSGARNFAIGGGGASGAWGQAGAGSSTSMQQIVTTIQLRECEIGSFVPPVVPVAQPVLPPRVIYETPKAIRN